MANNLLPESVNLMLDKVETNLCILILSVMILCTIQLTAGQLFDIGCTVYQNVSDWAENLKEMDWTFSGIIQKIKDTLLSRFLGKSNQVKGKDTRRNACLTHY